MATFSITASISSTANNLLTGTALSLTSPVLNTVSKDAAYSNVYIPANASQSLYSPSDSGANVAPITYVYVQANGNEVTIERRVGATQTVISKLTGSEWMYLPFPRSTTNDSASLWAVAGASAVTLAVLYAETGSV